MGVAKEITFESIKTANELITTTNIKGKEYAEVNQRIKAFRSLYPTGQITTEIVSNEQQKTTKNNKVEEGYVCIIKATVCDENGKILGTGLAYEKENSSFINTMSYIENCETSAIGRALGACGFGINTSVASAEEVKNAQLNQHNDNPNNQQPQGEQNKQAPDGNINYGARLWDLLMKKSVDADVYGIKYGLNQQSTQMTLKQHYEMILKSTKEELDMLKSELANVQANAS